MRYTIALLTTLAALALTATAATAGDFPHPDSEPNNWFGAYATFQEPVNFGGTSEHYDVDSSLLGSFSCEQTHDYEYSVDPWGQPIFEITDAWGNCGWWEEARPQQICGYHPDADFDEALLEFWVRDDFAYVGATHHSEQDGWEPAFGRLEVTPASPNWRDKYATGVDYDEQLIADNTTGLGSVTIDVNYQFDATPYLEFGNISCPFPELQ